MKYLLDTHVVSEHRKKARMNPAVRAWFDKVDERDCCLSVLVVGELRRGIESLRRHDARQAARLDVWLTTLETGFAPRILGVDPRVADLWGRLRAPDPLPPVDGLLAATALTHGLTLVTRNVRDIQATGARLLDPFTPLP